VLWSPIRSPKSCPGFDASRVHPLIREFYEHTSRFKLSIVPEWRAWRKPRYAVFKRMVAEPLGQAAIPSKHRGGAARDGLDDRHDRSRRPPPPAPPRER
jgi:hypothetical protein